MSGCAACDLRQSVTSPLKRAVARTCELAGFGVAAEIDSDLVEWNYGKYEGRTSAEIHAERPDWDLFRDGCPEGERPEQIGARADKVVSRVRAVPGNVLLFLERAHPARARLPVARNRAGRRQSTSS